MECHTTVVERRETFLVWNVSVTIDTQVRICGQRGADVYDHALDAQWLDRAYAQADALPTAAQDLQHQKV